MKRREFLALVGGAMVASSPARAQPAAKVRRIGFMGNSTETLEANLVGPFRASLRNLGYVEGRDIVIEYRWAEGDYERFPVLVAELIAAGADVIVTAGTPAAFAVKKATSSIPCVMVAVGDPVGTGLVASLERPGSGGQAAGVAARNGADAFAFRRALESGQSVSHRCGKRGAGCGEGAANEGAVARCAIVRRVR